MPNWTRGQLKNNAKMNFYKKLLDVRRHGIDFDTCADDGTGWTEKRDHVEDQRLHRYSSCLWISGLVVKSV